MSTETKFIPPIASEYGFQTIFTGPAPRPEPERTAPGRIDAAAIVTRYDLSGVEDIDTQLKAFGFPAALGWTGRVRHHENGGISTVTRTVYDADRVRAWEDAILQLADVIRSAR